ncbi:MAG: alpha-isopropylmalate synthase regulatory domain-containing protein [Ilumatobacteraceae bacterium]
MRDTFQREYLPESPRFVLRTHELHTTSNEGEGRSKLTAQLSVDGEPVTVQGEGDGPVEAFVAAIVSHFGHDFDVVDYTEHAIGRGSNAQAVAYVETVGADGDVKWGVGKNPNITTATMRGPRGLRAPDELTAPSRPPVLRGRRA